MFCFACPYRPFALLRKSEIVAFTAAIAAVLLVIPP